MLREPQTRLKVNSGFDRVSAKAQSTESIVFTKFVYARSKESTIFTMFAYAQSKDSDVFTMFSYAQNKESQYSQCF